MHVVRLKVHCNFERYRAKYVCEQHPRGLAVTYSSALLFEILVLRRASCADKPLGALRFLACALRLLVGAHAASSSSAPDHLSHWQHKVEAESGIHQSDNCGPSGTKPTGARAIPGEDTNLFAPSTLR